MQGRLELEVVAQKSGSHAQVSQQTEVPGTKGSRTRSTRQGQASVGCSAWRRLHVRGTWLPLRRLDSSK